MHEPTLYRYLSSVIGAIVAFLEPALPFIFICTVAIFFDCYTAWSLSKRVRKKYPDRTKKDSGKFKSSHFGNVLMTLMKVYALIILSYLMNTYITMGAVVDLTRVTAGAVCFWQLWSIFENESSCSDSKWAKIARKILVDKTERHFDIDLSELNDKKNENKRRQD